MAEKTQSKAKQTYDVTRTFRLGSCVFEKEAEVTLYTCQAKHYIGTHLSVKPVRAPKKAAGGQSGE